MNPLLEVRHLVTAFHLDRGVVRAVNDVSFNLDKGERLGVVGESGSGKTVTALSILGLIDPPGRIDGGQVIFAGEDLRGLNEGRYRRVRGAQIGMIFQDPLTSLNPLMTIGAQLVEIMRVHAGLSRSQARRRAVDLLGDVGIPRPSERMRDRPHQLSGGMRQRVGIAMALAPEPALLIADEPTTALDVTIQAQILDLLDHLCSERGLAVMLITHDLGVVSGFCDQVMVMYTGRVVEMAPAAQFFGGAARHPYSSRLLQSVSRIDGPRVAGKWVGTIPGSPPDLARLPPGCGFAPRCPWAGAQPECGTEVPVLEPLIGPGHLVACHVVGRAEAQP
ncbi:MAG: ABC transporter ATP-binding protein [Acidimicrobiales bacterium]